jgi:hypothetical protein
MNVRAIAFCVAFLAALAPACADDVYAPANLTLTQLMHRHLAAIGKAATWSTRREEWSFTEEGLAGTEVSVSRGADSRTTVVQGPFHTAYGRSGGQLWEQNENGITRNVRGLHQRSSRNAEALESLDRPESGAVLLGEVQRPCTCYVVDLDPAGGRHEHVFYDALSWMIVRRDISFLHENTVETFDDYRSADGAMTPFHEHFSNGITQDETDWRLTRVAYDVPVSDDDIRAPDSNVAITMPSDKALVMLPVTMQYRRIIVHLDIGGKPLDFILDSGTDGIILDSATAAQLQLQTYGSEIAVAPKRIGESRAIIPELRVGDIAMQNVTATTTPFAQDDGDYHVVGLLGYDFLAELVIRIDYPAGTVTAINPSAFAVPARAREIDANLDDGVPVVPVGVGHSVAQFILDTGADFPMVFSSFAASHPDDCKDAGLHAEIADAGTIDPLTTENLGLNSVVGVGGEHDITSVTLQSFHFGRVDFNNALVWIEPKGDGYEGEDIDGLLGSEILQYFVVYLDYGNSRVLVEPAM